MRRRVLDAVGWRCERCGNGPPLEVHHRDGDRANNDPSNLEALCGGPRGCHAREHDRLKDRPKAREWREFARELTR